MNQIIIEYRPELHNPPRRSPLILGVPNKSVNIVPGVKNYEIDKWDAIKQLPIVWEIVESLLGEGVLRIISESKEETDSAPKLPENMAQAIALIKKTFSLELLNIWKESDIRPGIQKAIDLQIAEGFKKEEKAEDKPTFKPKGKPVKEEEKAV